MGGTFVSLASISSVVVESERFWGLFSDLSDLSSCLVEEFLRVSALSEVSSLCVPFIGDVDTGTVNLSMVVAVV